MQQWLSPIRILLLYLVVLAIGASLSSNGLDVIFWVTQFFHFGLLFGSGWVTYQVLLKTKLGKPTRLENHLITALILFLLFDPTIVWYGFVFLGVATEAVQRLVRVPTGPLLNPAAVGAALATFLGFYPFWWGVSFAPRLMLFEGGMSVALLLTLPVAGYVAHKYKKLPIVAATLVTFIITYLLVLKMSPVFVLFEGTLTFFLLVMAIEPKTSPALRNQQLAYGGLLGFLTVMSIKWHWLEPYSMALIVVNLIFNLYKNKTLLLMKLQPKVTPVTPAPATPSAQPL
jgi:hypothetical protein